MEEQKSKDWRDEVSDSSKATLKIQDGETEKFVFLNEGEKRTHSDYGTSIVFEVEHKGEQKAFYVNINNFAFQKQIKELGTLTGKVVEVSRTGSKKSDTRYEIKIAN